MKKTAVLLLAGALCAALLSGCGKKEETAEPEISLAAVENVVEQKEEPPAHEGEARSALTGEWIDEETAALRPFAVMMGNTKIATPQYGISSADVIYEAPVEGSETRLMPMFQDYRSVEKICSVRSCRLYYIDWALEFDAIYGHYGQAYLAKDMLAEDYVNNLAVCPGRWKIPCISGIRTAKLPIMPIPQARGSPRESALWNMIRSGRPAMNPTTGSMRMTKMRSG